MAVRRSARRPRRSYGTIAVLSLLGAGLVWILVPLSRGEPIPSPRALFGRLLSGNEVMAAESVGDTRNTEPAEGQVRVFVSGRHIPAYSKILRDDLWNAARSTWAYTDVDASLAESAGILVRVEDIVGRVLAHDKAPSYVFTEKDFLPAGTRRGLSAGVPAGKRALRIEVDKVRGIVGLQPGDRFDIMAATPWDRPSAAANRPDFKGLYSKLMGESQDSAAFPRARVLALVQSGVVVTPLETRQIPTTSTSLTRGTSVRTLPVQEMVIAIDPDEVAPLMEALSIEANITCLARSGRPDDPLDSVTSSSAPPLSAWSSFLSGESASMANHGSLGSIAVIESIDDQERTFVPVPSAPAGDSFR